MDVETRVLLQKYLQLIAQRASGKLMTTAAWMRKFVREHPTYKFDSVITEDIAYDLVEAAHKIATGAMDAPELLGGLNK
jgi:glutamate--cysteine ligase catalytic subunit